MKRAKQIKRRITFLRLMMAISRTTQKRLDRVIFANRFIVGTPPGDSATCYFSNDAELGVSFGGHMPTPK